MQSTNVTLTPVQNVAPIATASGPVGYMLFNDHIATAESALINAVNTLRAANITDLVLDIRYNGKSVPVVVKDGRARVAEPIEGDKVSFVLRRNDASKERYGVVLLVNGENTLYKQRLSPELCTKWIFDPGAEPYTVCAPAMRSRPVSTRGMACSWIGVGLS